MADIKIPQKGMVMIIYMCSLCEDLAIFQIPEEEFRDKIEDFEYPLRLGTPYWTIPKPVGPVPIYCHKCSEEYKARLNSLKSSFKEDKEKLKAEWNLTHG